MTDSALFEERIAWYCLHMSQRLQIQLYVATISRIPKIPTSRLTVPLVPVSRPSTPSWPARPLTCCPHCVERGSGNGPLFVNGEWPRSRPFPVRVGLRGRMRTGSSRTSKSATPHGYPAGYRVSQRDALHPSTPRCESIWRRRSATANSTLTCRTCAECPPRGCPCIVCLVAS